MNDTEPLRVTTLWQPWASLVIVGAKPFEFRGGNPPSTIVNQRVVIHAAAQRMDRQELTTMLIKLKRGEGDDLCLFADKAIPVLEAALDDQLGFPGHGTLPWGSGLGTVLIGEGRNGVAVAREWFGADPELGDEFDANRAWPINAIERWEHAVPGRGKQGIWFWRDEVPQGQPVEARWEQPDWPK